MNNNMNNSKRENNKVWINTMQPMNFCVASEVTFISTNELSKKINYMFKHTFSDCQGCVLQTDGKNKIDLMLYFDDNKSTSVGNIKAIERVSYAEPKNINDQILNFNTRSTKHVYRLTKEAKDIFTQFLPKNNKRNTNWNYHFEEKYLGDGFKQSILCVIHNLDVTAVIEQIFGKYAVTSNGNDRLAYRVFIEKPLTYVIEGKATNFQLRIERMYINNSKLIAEQLGTIQSETIPMVRDMSSL